MYNSYPKIEWQLDEALHEVVIEAIKSLPGYLPDQEALVQQQKITSDFYYGITPNTPRYELPYA